MSESATPGGRSSGHARRAATAPPAATNGAQATSTALLDPRPRNDRDPVAPNGDHADQPAAARRRPGEGKPTLADDDRPGGWRGFMWDVRQYRVVAGTHYGLTPLLVFGFIGFFQRFDSRAFSLASPDIARDLNISVGDIIGIQALVGTVATIALLFAGYYADRHRRVPFVSIGTLISGFFSAVTGRAQSFAGAATPRVLDDVADAASGVPQFSLTTDYYPPAVRGRVFALLGMFSKVAELLSPVIVGLCVVGLGWRTSFLVFAVPLMLLGVAAHFLLKEPIRGYQERKAMGASEEVARQEEEPLSFAEGCRATWSVRTVRRTVVADVFTFGADAILSLYFVFFLAEVYGLDALERGIVFLPAVVARLAGGFIGGAVVDRLTRRNPSRVLLVLGVYGLMLVPAPLVYLLQPPLWIIVGISLLTGFGGSLIGPATQVVYSQVIPPGIRTQGLSITALAGIPTTAMFIPIARGVFSEYGYDGIWVMSIPLGVVGALIYLTAAGFFELDMRNNLAASMAAEEWRRTRAAGKGKLLVCRNIDVAYDGVQVLFDVDFDVDDGEIIALLGTNGAGKSTLLRAISGIQEASSGAIVFDGRDITHMPPHETAGRGVVQMPGGKGVFPNLSVKENLVLGSWMNEDQADVSARLAEVFEIFPALRDRIDTPAGQLSGGEQQQLSLAQAFLCRPRLLLIDELSLGLAPTVVGQLVEIVKEINRRGVTVIVVEQSVNVALTIATRAVFMEKGEVRFDGPAQELLARPDILRAVYVKGTGALTDGVPAAARRDERQVRSLGLAEARPVLEVSGLLKTYGGITAVDDVSFQLREGEVLGLIGPNGAGKTTIFDLISGHQPLDGGRVVLEGADVTKWAPEMRARAGLVRRFQDARLFPSLTVFETLLVSLEQRLEVKSAFLNAVAAPQARKAERRVRARAEKLIELLDLDAYRDKFVKELSTGLRRIVDLACVLAAEPKVLLLDEPSSGIAQAEAEGLAPLLTRVRFETGCSILIIEHDMPLISAVSDELIALDLGAVVRRGRPEDVLVDERVVESYLGTSEAAINRSGSTI
ncbi:MAG: MFS transporter [Actinomycetota bacterium]